MKDPLFDKLSNYNQNILKWAALLHDIRKRGRPTVSGKDHIHPFMSGACTLEIFKELEIITIESEEQKNEFKRLIGLV